LRDCSYSTEIEDEVDEEVIKFIKFIKSQNFLDNALNLEFKSSGAKFLENLNKFKDGFNILKIEANQQVFDSFKAREINARF